MAASPTPGQAEHDHDNTMERSLNGTSGMSEFNDWMRILSLVIALLGLLGNTTVLWLLGFRIRRNPFSVYLLNLAGADSLFLCATCVIDVLSFVGYLHFNATNIVVNVAFLSYSAGLSLLAAISTERCLSAIFPFWYRSLRPKHTSRTVSAVLWTLAGGLAVLDYVYCHHAASSPYCHTFFIFPAVWFFLLTLLLCLSSLTLLLRVRCSSGHRQPPRLYGLVLLAVLVFLICGLPYGISDAMHHLGIGFIPLGLPAPLACVNSGANPFIYFFLGSQRQRRGREPLITVLQRVLGEEEKELGGGRDNPHTNNQET